MKNHPSPQRRNHRQIWVIAVIMGIGLLLGGLILGTQKQGADGDSHEAPSATARPGSESVAGKSSSPTADAPGKGPHGGRLFVDGSFSLELTIFETGVRPQFRLYSYKNGKPLDPSLTQAVVTIHRLGRQPQVFAFAPEGGYLKGDGVVEEPHSFAVGIAADYAGQSFRFKFEQVEARMAMSDQQLKSNGVEVASVGPARIQTVLKLVGEVRLNGDRTVHIVPRLAGVVESVAANAGDRVRRGQVLAVLSSQTLADQRSDWLAAQKRLALARTTYSREKSLWEDKISAEQDFLQARQALQEAEIVEQNAQQKLTSLGAPGAAKGQLTRYEIRSPIDGVITDKKISVGEVLKDDASIFVVADLSTVWVDMTVYPQDLGALKIGQQATVKATSLEAQAGAKLMYVSALVGEQTRTATARVLLNNPTGVWRPGLPVNVELITGEVTVPMAVSVDAVQSLRDWTVVFGRYADQFEARVIEQGRSDGKMVEVIKGLEPGERYAARNSYLIKADVGKSGASHDH